MTTCVLLFDPEAPENGPFELIRNHCGYVHLSSLLRIWFAEAEAGAALTIDETAPCTPNSLQVRLEDVRRRMAQFADVARRHPLAGHRPEIPLWLDGIEHLFRQWQSRFEPAAADRIRLGLQLHCNDCECPIDEHETENFRELFTTNWHDLLEAATQDKFSLVDELLLFSSYSLNFGDWLAWTRQFGLDQLPDPYFRRLDDQPLTYTPNEQAFTIGPYAEFIAEDESSADAEGYDAMALWSLTPADILPFETVTAHEDQELLIGRQGGLYGLFDPQQKHCVCVPYYDELHWTGCYTGSLLLARKAGLWGFIDTDGNVRQPCRFEERPAPGKDAQGEESRPAGWSVRENQRTGWIDEHGEQALPCLYDEVLSSDASGLYLVRQATKWGLALHGGQLLLPCAYEAIRPLGLGPDAPAPGPDDCSIVSYWPTAHIGQWLADAPAEGRLLLIEVRDKQGTHVVDQAGRQIIPPGYAGFSPVRGKWAEYLSWQDQNHLELHDETGHHGIWNVRTASLGIPCVHGQASALACSREHPLLVLLSDKSCYDEDDPPLFRVVDANNQPVLPGEYLWLNPETASNNAYFLCTAWSSELEALADALANRKTLFAQRMDAGKAVLVTVCAGQPDKPVETALSESFAEDAAPWPARQLALLYENPDSVAHDPEKASHWRKQARDAAIRKLSEQPVEAIADEDLELYRDVLLDYICALYNEDSSKKARRAARAEIDHMLRITTYWGCSTTLDLVCGMVLIDAAAGKPNFERGLLSLEIAASSHCAEAAYHLGRCYLFGHGVERDALKAREFLADAEKGGDSRALNDLIATLVLLSSRRDIPEDERAAFDQELTYFKEKRDEEESNLTPFIPKIRAQPRFSGWRPRLLAALWKLMN